MRVRRTAWFIVLTASLARADLYPPLEKAWEVGFEQGCYMTPTVVGDTVYIGSRDNSVYALDRLTGTIRWQFDAGGRVYGGIAVVGDTLVAASDNGMLHCLAAADGTVRWQKQVDQTLYATPVVGDNTIFIGGGATGAVFAIDLNDGDEQWQFTLGDRMGSGLVVDDGVVYVPSYDGHLYALDAVRGTQLWSFDAGGAVDSMPLLDGDTIYVKLPTDALFALSRETGRELWSARPENAPAMGTGPSNWSPLVLHDGKLLYGSLDGRIHAVDAESGREVWASVAGAPRPCPPTPTGDIGWAGGKDGSLTAFDLATGEVVERLQVSNVPDLNQVITGCMWPPLVVDDMVYVPTLERGLTVYRGEPDGTVWRTLRERTRGLREALAPAFEGGPTPSDDELIAMQTLALRYHGFVVWESRRTGAWELFRINLDGTGFRQLTQLHAPNDPLAWAAYLRPQVSPDGRQVLFANGRRGGAAEVWSVPADGGEPRKLTDGHPLRWENGGGEVLFARDRRVWRLNVTTGEEAPLNDVEIPNFDVGMVGDVTASLDAMVLRTARANEFFPFAAGRTTFQLGGCEPQFTRDGQYLYWVQGPKDFRLLRLGEEDSKQLLGQPPTEPYNYTYFPTICGDGRLLAYGASPGQHSHETGDYEIYVTELRDLQAVGTPVRYSWNPTTDRWPYVWVAQ